MSCEAPALRLLSYEVALRRKKLIFALNCVINRRAAPKFIISCNNKIPNVSYIITLSTKQKLIGSKFKILFEHVTSMQKYRPAHCQQTDAEQIPEV